MRERSIEAHSHNHSCHGKTVSITYSQWESLTLVSCNAYAP